MNGIAGKPAPILALGEAALHVISTKAPRPEISICDIALSIGGPATVVAAQLQALGQVAKLVASCGRDNAGTYVRSLLNRHGVDTSHLLDLGATTVVNAVVGNDGSVALAASPGVVPSFADLPANFEAALDGAGIIYATGFPGLVPLIQSLGSVRAVVDVGFTPLLDRPDDLLDHISRLSPWMETCIFSSGNMRESDIARVSDGCLRRGVDTVLVTRGAAGVDIIEEDRTVRIPAFEAVVRDPLSAGDCFVAGFIAERNNGKGTLDAVQYGQAAAAVKVSRLGGLADSASVEALLATRTGHE